MYHEQVDRWNMHINDMEETLDIPCNKNMNAKLGEKEEVPDTLQMYM